MVGYNQNQPDVWGAFADGMEIGGALRRRQQQTEYGEAYQQGGWEAVGDTAGGQGDLQTAERAQGVSQAQQANSRTRAIENATVLRRLYTSLTPLDENTRRERLTQLAPQLEQYNIDANTLAQIDTSEQGWATLGQSLYAALGQLERYTDIRETDDGALVGITADGQSEVIREAPPPAWQQIPQDQLPQGARFGQRNTRTGQADFDWTPQAASGGMGENQYSMLDPAEVEAQGLAPGSYQRNNATSQITTVGRTRGQYASRMAAADQTLTELESMGVDPTGVYVGRFVGGSADERRYRQAQREFVNAILRRESGAVIADSEFNSAAQQYFPVPGDPPEVIEQKRQARQRSLQGLINASQGA
jgi:hypothetical protein